MKGLAVTLCMGNIGGKDPELIWPEDGKPPLCLVRHVRKRGGDRLSRAEHSHTLTALPDTVTRINTHNVLT